MSEKTTAPIVRVFISSTWLDLQPEREAVERAIQRLRATKFVGMEYFGSHDEVPRQVSLDEVDRSQLYVGIFGGRYGSGITEDEYRRAREHDLPCLIYIKDEDQIDPDWQETDPEKAAQLEALKEELRQTHTVTFFSTPEDLAARLTANLHRWLFDEYLSPRLEKAASDEFPREKAQALLTSIQDLSVLNQELLARLEQAGYLTVEEQARKLAQYRQRVLEDTRFVNWRGIPLPVDRSGRRVQLQVPLDKVYIRLQAVEEERGRAREAAERRAVEEQIREEAERRAADEQIQQEREEGFSATSILDRLITLGEYLYRRGQVYQAAERPDPVDPTEAIQEHGRLVILGAPGSGKSTLLRYLAHQVAGEREDRIPILVLLRDYATALDKDSTLSLRELALREVAEGDQQLRRTLEEAIESGEVLWLVDGLDEARGWRTKAARQAGRLPGQLILTSRPVGYERAGLQSLPHFEVLPLTPDDVNQFLHDWFELLAELRGGDTEWVDTRVTWLQEQLEQRPRIQSLTQNPLLLTFLVILAGEDPLRDLPRQRPELYRRYVEELLDSWEAYRYPQSGPTGEPTLALGPLTGDDARLSARRGFYYLGWYLHLVYYGGHGRDTQPNRRHLTAKLCDYYMAEGAWSLTRGTAQTLVDDVVAFWREAGVLDVWPLEGDEFLAFRHLTFQEYAAARVLEEAFEKDPERTWEQTLCPILHHYAWREPILLLAGLSDEDCLNDLVQYLLDGLSPYERSLHRDLRLAAALVSEGAVLDERLMRQIVSRLVGAVRSHAGKRSTPALPVPPKVQAILTSHTHFWEDACVSKELFVRALGELGNARAIEPLIQALGDSDESVREAAAEALGEIGDGRAIEPLIVTLGDSDWRVWRRAVGALGEIGDAAVEPLIGALGDSRLQVRWHATKVLRAIGNAAVEPLILVLDDSDSHREVRRAAAEALGEIGGLRAVEPLIQALGDNDSDVRWAAAGALGQIGDARAIEPLIVTLGDSDWRVRRRAVGALGKLGDAAVEPLIGALGDSRLQVRKAAARALGQIDDVRTVEPLIQVLGDSDSHQEVRQTAAGALGQVGDAAVEPLSQALRDSEFRVRRAAAWGLEAIGDAAVEPLIGALGDSHREVRWRAAGALGKIGDAAVEPLVLVLDDSDSHREVRRAAAEALGAIGDPRAVEPLSQALGDSEWRVREAAAEALGEIGDGRAIEPLIGALGDSRLQVRRAAAEALEAIGDARAVESLIHILGDGNLDVRRAAVGALGAIGDGRAVEPLIGVLGDSDKSVRKAAAWGLGEIGDPRAVEPLIQVLGDSEDWVRQYAALALGKIGDPAVEPLIQALEDSDSDVREAAAGALGEIADSIRDERTAQRIARALRWRLTDVEKVSKVAFQALERVANRLAVLEVDAQPIMDPLVPHPPAPRPRWQRWSWAILLLLAIWLTDLTTEILTNQLAGQLDQSLPRGTIGLLVLILGSILIFALARYLQETDSQQDQPAQSPIRKS